VDHLLLDHRSKTGKQLLQQGITIMSKRLKPRLNSGKTGSGKSTSIRLKLLINSYGIASILAVPSKELQKEYHSRLLDSTHHINLVTLNRDMIHSNETVSEMFLSELLSNNTISITHEALKLVDHRSISTNLYANRDLILDEAFVPVWSKEITVKQSNKSGFNNLNIDWVEWLNPTGNVIGGFIELRPRKSKFYSNLLDMQMYSTIENPNFKVYISESNWESLLKNDAYKINIFGVFDLEILTLFRSVYIASAAFHTTLLGIMMEKIDCDLIVEQEFEKHDEPFVFHVATNNDKLYSHSKSSIKDHFDTVKQFRQYVDDTLDGRECLLLRNVIDTSDVADNYVHITNNCHGINHHRHIDAISIESTYNPNTNFRAFMRNVMEFTDDEILLSIAANTFYQSIMRTSARDADNNNPVDVFLLDSKVLPLLQKYYFNNVEVKHVDVNIGKSHLKKQRTVVSPYKDRIESNEHVDICEFVESLPKGKHKANDIYESYVKTNNSVISNKMFATSLEKLGIVKKRTRNGFVYTID
jgi:hypothetical protein